MSNRKYKALLRIAETGSFTQAALDLGYSQAGISGMISSLEKEMGVQLVVRDYGEARLSVEGAELLPWISNVCNGERQLASRVAELKRLERGIVHVAAPTSVSICWFPSIAKALQRRCPGVELQLMHIDDEGELERALWHGDADCGFLVAPAKRALKTIPLHNDPIMVLLPPDSHTPTTFPRKRFPRNLSSNQGADRRKRRKRCCAISECERARASPMTTITAS